MCALGTRGNGLCAFAMLTFQNTVVSTQLHKAKKACFTNQYINNASDLALLYAEWQKLEQALASLPIIDTPSHTRKILTELLRFHSPPR